MEKKEAKSCNCCCCNALTWVAIILSACTLIWGAALWTCIYNKVSTLHKVVVEAQYGSAENFNKVFDAYMTDEYKKQINEDIDAQVEQIKASQKDAEETSNEDTTNSDTNNDAAKLVNPDSTDWEDISDEAYTLFEISGTPGNAIINTETRMYKVIGGAYPQSAFEAAIPTVKDGTAQTDDMGNAGYLTEEQLTKLLDGVYYKDDNNNAKIIIVEYSDLLCPFCKRHYNDRTLENIVEADNSIALVFKNMPIPSLHPNAPLGAKGVDCAGELGGSKAYYEFLDAAFAESDFTAENIAAIAKKLGLDADAFAACYNA